MDSVDSRIAKDPSCPKGIMQWQHGAFTLFVNGSIVLNPIAVDGRQLLSDPCKKDIATYTRYNQTEFFKVFTNGIDSPNLPLTKTSVIHGLDRCLSQCPSP